MKIAQSMMALMLAAAAVMSTATADTYSSAASADDPESDGKPKIEQDAYGAPLSLTESKKTREPTQAEIEADQKQQAQADKDKDWLMRSYQQQLKINSPDLSADNDKNFYYKFRSNPDLAKLAGLTPLDPDPTAELKTGATDSNKGAPTLRADLSPANDDAYRNSYSSAIFKPLIIPLGSPDAGSVRNFYALTPFESAPLLPSDNRPARTAPPPDVAKEIDPMAIETPGLVAAESDPAVDSTNLTLDLLPGESISEAQARQDNVSPLELPLKTDLARLHSQQETALNIPGAPQNAPVATIKPLLQKYPNDFEPVKIAPPNTIRAPIADPYDIFYR